MGRFRLLIILLALVGLVACGGGRDRSSGTDGLDDEPVQGAPNLNAREARDPNDTIWNLFNRGSNEARVQVNRYLWFASLQVLDFLPVQTIDPYTGVIVTGFGTPPGGGRSYRATVLIDDPALEARSLKLSLQTRNGPVSAATTRAIEDAIMTRARQLRVADGRL